MNENVKNLLANGDGMEIYEYIVNHAEEEIPEIGALAERLCSIDLTGQFLCSTARFLNACCPERFTETIPSLIEAAIDRDHERRYIGSLLQAIWGEDFEKRADSLSATDDNFRRIFRRMHENPENL